MTAPLVAVAHGSRDPRSAATIHALLDVVRSMRPDLDVRVAFLDLSAPRVGDVLSAVHGAGHPAAVVVPLLLGRAFHARVDVPAAVADAQRRYPRFQVHICDVLGPDPRLDEAAWRRMAEAGVSADDPDLGVILAGAGSSHAPANRLVSAVAARWQAKASWAGASAAFAAAAEPGVPAAIEALRARGARRFAVGSWFLAPGLLPDRISSLAREYAADPLIAAPMADDVGVADLVLQRYTDTLAAATSPRLQLSAAL
ncbi:sirohydrochlorin chelatase [Saccharopolyspora sp. 5N708]|uniref:sirohydrochlorin chelatase n=1 Tax=Saccharopolyspora sp. 5N708 TaxID=3457424 RepID=UPI003FD04F85